MASSTSALLHAQRRLVAVTYRAGRHGNLALVHEGDVETNDDEMSASCILASSNRDRQGDIIECSGVDFRDHRVNPISLWDHGKKYELPIGVTETPDEEYTVRYDPETDIITQRTFFNDVPFSRQIYGLIRKRFIRANSIAVKDVQVEELPPDPEAGHYARRDRDGKKIPYKHIIRSILAEVTWTPLPANPDAVASLLGRGRVNTGGFADELLDPLIRKSFLPFVPRRRLWDSGLTLKSRTCQPSPGAEKTMGEERVEDKDKDQKARTRKDDMDGGDTTVESETPGADEEMLPGAQALHHLHDFKSAGHDLASELKGGQENARVRELLDEFAEDCRDWCQRIRDAFEEEYPDHEGPEPLEEESEDSEELDTKSEDELRDKPEKVNETAGRPIPDTKETEQGNRAAAEERSRTRRSLTRRRVPAGTSSKSLSTSDPLLRAIERKRARLIALETEDLD